MLGCKPYVDHGDWRASAQLTLDPERGVRISVSLDGEVDLDTLRDRATAVVAPLLNHRQREAIADVLREVQHATDNDSPEPPAMRIDNARISGYVAIDREAPWLRYLDLRVVLPRPNQRDLPDIVPDRGAGLGPGVATVDDRAITAWKELCRDDDEIHDLLGYRPMSPSEQAAWATGDTERWELGDLWIRCQVLHAGDRKERKYGLPMGIVATWEPTTRQLVYLQVAASDLERAGGALALLKRVLAPVLDPTRRACVGADAVRLIDVLWIDPTSEDVAAAFEVEHTTSIYSGIVRMLDLALGAPERTTRGLFLVAPDSREDDVRAQLQRPAFSQVRALQMRFLPYSELERNREAMARFGRGLHPIEAASRSFVP